MSTSSPMDTSCEAALVASAFKGEPAAFGRIVVRYQEPVYNMCARFLGCTEAEDVAQETFVRAFVHRERFDPARPLLPWLFTIARRLCIDKVRSRKHAPVCRSEEVVARHPGVPVDDALGTREELTILAKAIESLPEGQREAIIQHHVEGLSYQEVATTLDVPIGTVMTWLHRGRAKLKMLLKTQSDVSLRRGEPEETHVRIG